MSNRALTRARRWSRSAVVGLAVGATAVIGAPGAQAAPGVPEATLDNIPGAEHCDVGHDPLGTCLSIAVNGGLFSNNGFELPISEGDLNITAEYTADGELASTDTENFGVYAKPMTVPGGVLGVDLPFNNLFGLAAVTAQVQAVDTPELLGDVFELDIDMPVRMKLENPFLGGNCYLGSPEEPVVLGLRGLHDGANAPVMGVVGVPEYPADTLEVTNVNNVATDFELPAASGCGPFGVLNPIVNWRAKTPATTGTSIATEATAYMYAPGDLVATPSPEDSDANGSLGSAGSLGS